jgi:S1-C subfamily serine protease
VKVKDADLDLAILEFKTDEELREVLLGNSDDITVGEHIISIGNPLGLEHTLTDGLVSSRRSWQDRPMIQMSVPVSPGNSGGPIFTTRGEVMGVTTFKLGKAFNRGENLNLAVPINELKPMLDADYAPGKTNGTW